MRDRYRVQRSLEGFEPERQKAVQHWKFRAEIVVLPDVGLQQRGMIGQSIQDLRRGKAITFELALEVLGSRISGRRLGHHVLEFHALEFHHDALRFWTPSVLVISNA